MTYSEKLRDPRWQKKRLEILNRDDWTCCSCLDASSPLAVHHLVYRAGKDPWEYENDELITLCESCHTYEYETAKDAERGLVDALKMKGFLSGNLIDIGSGIRSMNKFHIPDVMASVLEWLFRNDDLLDEITKKYFEFISARNKENER